ncbi:MAG: hypothetical protein SPL54_01300 [Lachnospiraceae bacterium]|jgi:hypothetical protein|nr:hypothetical protein [Lachnospiraceae bacterium]
MGSYLTNFRRLSNFIESFAIGANPMITTIRPKFTGQISDDKIENNRCNL